MRHKKHAPSGRLGTGTGDKHGRACLSYYSTKPSALRNIDH